MDAARKLGFGDRFDEVKKLVEQKKPGEPEPRALLDIKAAIRRSEACGACRSFGLDDETNVHFLNLPFYESGGIKKLPSSQIDVDIIKDFLESIKPDQVYMAGDWPTRTALIKSVRKLQWKRWNNCEKRVKSGQENVWYGFIEAPGWNGI